LPFLASRILRIYPGFVVAALLATLALVPLFSQAKSIGGVDFLALLKGLTKLSLVGVPDVFIHTHYPTLNGAMWTIPYEFKCYMLVLACGLLGLLSHRAAWLAITLAASAVHLAGQLDWAPAALGLYSRFLMAFGAGGCFYLYRDTIPWRLDMAWLALLTFIGALSFKHLAEPALCIFWGYAVVFYALKGRALLAFNQLPDISYGIYLYAWPINKVVLWYAPTMNVYLLMACVLALSIVAGTISWYLVEKPFIRLKKYLPAGPAKDGRHLASS
jgi:peptidoglycan/LPS O-acetylase OafA/YrhL